MGLVFDGLGSCARALVLILDRATRGLQGCGGSPTKTGCKPCPRISVDHVPDRSAIYFECPTRRARIHKSLSRPADTKRAMPIANFATYGARAAHASAETSDRGLPTS